MKTFMAYEQTIERKWYVVDAAGQTMGRLASQVATLLRGKHKPEFTANVDCGDHVIVINSDKIVVSGNKLEDKYKWRHSGHMGGLKQIQYKKLMQDKSDEALSMAVKGMLPKNSLGRRMGKKLHVYKGAEHKHEAQQPVEFKLTAKRYN